MALRKIIVGFDGAPSSVVALDTAVRLSNRHKARLLGVAIEDERRFVHSSFLESLAIATGLIPNIPSPLPPDEMLETIEKVERESADLEKAFSARLKKEEIQFEFIVERDNVVDALSEHAKGADLLCLGRAGAHVAIREVEDSSSLQAISKIVPTPILATTSERCALQTVVLGFDGSNASYRTLKFVIEVAESSPDTKIFLTTVCSGATEAESIQAPAIEYLNSCRLPFETKHLSGNPGDELVELATDLSADLLAVGAFSSGLISEAINGGTTQAVIERAPNAILLVP